MKEYNSWKETLTKTESQEATLHYRPVTIQPVNPNKRASIVEISNTNKKKGECIFATICSKYKASSIFVLQYSYVFESICLLL